MRGKERTRRSGEIRMMDVSPKKITRRRAIARGKIRMKEKTLASLREGKVPKGDVLAAARVAGILAAKKTSELIPLCHPLPLDHIEVRFRDGKGCLEVEAEVTAEARTGVEMEALAAACVALLTVYDMCKGIDRGMIIDTVKLVKKTGGTHNL